MQFDRERVSWRGNEAVLDDFADLDWPDSDSHGASAHDPALAASLAATNRGRAPWPFALGADARRRVGDSDTEQGSLRSSGSERMSGDAWWGDGHPALGAAEAHTPRNVAAADSAFAMDFAALAALRAAAADEVLRARFGCLSVVGVRSATATALTRAARRASCGRGCATALTRGICRRTSDGGRRRTAQTRCTPTWRACGPRSGPACWRQRRRAQVFVCACEGGLCGE